MTTTLIIEYFALVLLLFCSAFFSSAETALFSLNPIQIRRMHRLRPKTAARIERILATPMHLLSTLLIGNTLVNITAAALGYDIVERFYPGCSEVISISAMIILLLIFGEVSPKRMAMLRPETLAAAYCPVLPVLIRIMTPARIALEWASGMFKRHLKSETGSLTKDEFRTVVELAAEQGVIDKEDRLMVDGIIGLAQTQASDVMIPRVDLIGIDLEDLPEKWKKMARSGRFRYLPVYTDTLDQPESFLDVPRYLVSDDQDLKAATILPFFVPETTPLDTLLETFLEENRRMAFVTDEFGGTAGLITRGLILAEIVPEVESEYGEAKPGILDMGDNIWLVHGRTSLEDINYELDLGLEAEGADRIAGWVNAMAEHIPRLEEVVEAQGCRVTVQRVKKNRVTHVLLEKVKKRKTGSE